MVATSNNPHNFAGKHYWPVDHFSTPADALCLNMAPSPDSDCWCVRPAGHAGAHQYEWSPTIRDYSWKDQRP
jgi:hypothetical protein